MVVSVNDFPKEAECEIDVGYDLEYLIWQNKK